MIPIRCQPCPSKSKICWCVLYPISPKDAQAIGEISREVAKKYGLTVKNLKSKSRKKLYVKARHEAMRRCRNESNANLKLIGQFFNRSHCSVLYAIKVFRK